MSVVQGHSRVQAEFGKSTLRACGNEQLRVLLEASELSAGHCAQRINVAAFKCCDHRVVVGE